MIKLALSVSDSHKKLATQHTSFKVLCTFLLAIEVKVRAEVGKLSAADGSQEGFGSLSIISVEMCLPENKQIFSTPAKY